METLYLNHNSYQQMLYFEYVLYFAFGIAALSFTISITGVFGWLRNLLSKMGKGVEELIHCPFCVAFWLTVGLGLGIPEIVPRIVSIFIVDFPIWVMAILGIVGILHYPLLRTYEPIGKLRLERLKKRLTKQQKNTTT